MNNRRTQGELAAELRKLLVRAEEATAAFVAEARMRGAWNDEYDHSTAFEVGYLRAGMAEMAERLEKTGAAVTATEARRA